MRHLVLIIASLALSYEGNAQQPRSKDTRPYFVRSMTGEVYPLIRPYRIRKTTQKIQQEHQIGLQFINQTNLAGAPKTPGAFNDGLDKYPRKNNLLAYMPPIRDQGDRGTCVAFASIAQLEIALNMPRRGSAPNLSENFAYWASKALDGAFPFSDGSLPIEVLKSLERHGTPSEAMWPYNDASNKPMSAWYLDQRHPDCVAAFKQTPGQMPTECITNGNPTQQARMAPKVFAFQAQVAPTSESYIVGALNNRIPVQVGVSVFKHAWGFDNVESTDFIQGRVRMPSAEGDEEVGGHAVLIVGYNRDTQEYIIRNSWGLKQWGSQSSVRLNMNGQSYMMRGYGTIPMEYVKRFGHGAIARPRLPTM